MSHQWQEGKRERVDGASQFTSHLPGGSQHPLNISGRTNGAWSLSIIGTEGRGAGRDGGGGGTDDTLFKASG